MLLRDAQHTHKRHTSVVVETSTMNSDPNSFSIDPSGQEFVDTSTWEQIIRILEESSIPALESADSDCR
jgi:hypothetical protein